MSSVSASVSPGRASRAVPDRRQPGERRRRQRDVAQRREIRALQALRSRRGEAAREARARRAARAPGARSAGVNRQYAWLRLAEHLLDVQLVGLARQRLEARGR